MDKFPNNVMCQVGIIVRDIEKTAKKYAEIFGMDMPEINLTAPQEQTHIQYRGESTQARAKLAFFNMGSLSLELIEPDENPSTWREFLDTKGEGVHHIAFNIKGMKQTVEFLESKEIPLVQKGEYTGGRYSYMDSVPQLAVMLELLEND